MFRKSRTLITICYELANGRLLFDTNSKINAS